MTKLDSTLADKAAYNQYTAALAKFDSQIANTPAEARAQKEALDTAWYTLVARVGRTRAYQFVGLPIKG